MHVNDNLNSIESGVIYSVYIILALSLREVPAAFVSTCLSPPVLYLKSPLNRRSWIPGSSRSWFV